MLTVNDSKKNWRVLRSWGGGVSLEKIECVFMPVEIKRLQASTVQPSRQQDEDTALGNRENYVLQLR